MSAFEARIDSWYLTKHSYSKEFLLKMPVRLALVMFVLVAFLFACLYLTDPRLGMTLCVCANVVAAPFGQKLIHWVDRDTRHAASNRGSWLQTSLITASIFLYVLIAIYLFGQSAIYSLDLLGHQGLLSFTRKGYREAQTYIVGTIGFPFAATAVAVTGSFIGIAGRHASIISFASGIYLSLLAFFAIAGAVGLPIGLEQPTVLDLAKAIAAAAMLGLVMAAAMRALATIAGLMRNRQTL